jgi:hypothetical protein
VNDSQVETSNKTRAVDCKKSLAIIISTPCSVKRSELAVKENKWIVTMGANEQSNKKDWLKSRNLSFQKVWTGLPDFSWYKQTKMGENIPNGQRIDRMAIKYRYRHLLLQDPPKFT